MVVLDPTYGEYGHVARSLLGIPVAEVRVPHPFRGEELVASLLAEVRPGDLLVLVNPNSPTGTSLTLAQGRDLLVRLPSGVRVWVDETYVEYVGAAHSLERIAAASASVVVCKSMSKVFALSGLRVAYLVGSPDTIQDLRRGVPPWSVSLPAMLAGILALEAPDYYAARLAETHLHRRSLGLEIERRLGWEVQEGAINCLLTRPATGFDPGVVIAECREQGVYVRGGAAMGAGARGWIRISVRSPGENLRIVKALACVAGL
jgi:histidinol-phosphate/aromatic aminotransferase/cobyric acid decarboxylase-like protein